MDIEENKFGHEFGYYMRSSRFKKRTPDFYGNYQYEYFFGVGENAAEVVSYTVQYESEEMEWLYGTPVKLRYKMESDIKEYTSASILEPNDEEAIPTVQACFERIQPNPLKTTPTKYCRAIAVIGDKTAAISVFINAIPTHRQPEITFTTDRKNKILFNCTFVMRGDRTQRQFFLPKLKKCFPAHPHQQQNLHIPNDPAPKRKNDEINIEDDSKKKRPQNLNDSYNFFHFSFLEKLQKDIHISLGIGFDTQCFFPTLTTQELAQIDLHNLSELPSLYTIAIAKYQKLIDDQLVEDEISAFNNDTYTKFIERIHRAMEGKGSIVIHPFRSPILKLNTAIEICIGKKGLHGLGRPPPNSTPSTPSNRCFVLHILDPLSETRALATHLNPFLTDPAICKSILLYLQDVPTGEWNPSSRILDYTLSCNMRKIALTQLFPIQYDESNKKTITAPGQYFNGFTPEHVYTQTLPAPPPPHTLQNQTFSSFPAPSLDLIIGVENSSWQSSLLPKLTHLGLYVEARPNDRSPKLTTSRIKGYTSEKTNHQLIALISNPKNVIYGMPTKLFQLPLSPELNLISIRVGYTIDFLSPSFPIATLKTISDVNNNPFVQFVAPLGGNVFKCVLHSLLDHIRTNEFVDALKKFNIDTKQFYFNSCDFGQGYTWLGKAPRPKPDIPTPKYFEYIALNNLPFLPIDALAIPLSNALTDTGIFSPTDINWYLDTQNHKNFLIFKASHTPNVVLPSSICINGVVCYTTYFTSSLPKHLLKVESHANEKEEDAIFENIFRNEKLQVNAALSTKDKTYLTKLSNVIPHRNLAVQASNYLAKPPSPLIQMVLSPTCSMDDNNQSSPPSLSVLNQQQQTISNTETQHHTAILQAFNISPKVQQQQLLPKAITLIHSNPFQPLATPDDNSLQAPPPPLNSATR